MQQRGTPGDTGEFPLFGIITPAHIFSYGYKQRKNTKDVQNIVRKEKAKGAKRKPGYLDKAVVASILDPEDFSSNTVNGSAWSIRKLATITEQISKHK